MLHILHCLYKYAAEFEQMILVSPQNMCLLLPPGDNLIRCHASMESSDSCGLIPLGETCDCVTTEGINTRGSKQETTCDSHRFAVEPYRRYAGFWDLHLYVQCAHGHDRQGHQLSCTCLVLGVDYSNEIVGPVESSRPASSLVRLLHACSATAL